MTTPARENRAACPKSHLGRTSQVKISSKIHIFQVLREPAGSGIIVLPAGSTTVIKTFASIWLKIPQ